MLFCSFALGCYFCLICGLVVISPLWLSLSLMLVDFLMPSWWWHCQLSSSLGFMDNQHWNVLCWNIRGINDSDKWDAIRQKIEESACSIVCLQETKHSLFDSAYIWNFAPRHFDNFEFFPSEQPPDHNTTGSRIFLARPRGLDLAWLDKKSHNKNRKEMIYINS